MIGIDEILHQERVRLKSNAVGKHNTTCPQCSHLRKPTNRKKPCLAVWIDGRGVGFHCIHCGWSKARFYDEGERGDARKIGTQQHARRMAGGRAQDSERDRSGDGLRVSGERSGVRVSSERRVVVPENQKDHSGREKLLHRPAAERSVSQLVQRGLPERTVQRGNASDHLRGGDRRVVVGVNRGAARCVRSERSIS